MQAGDSSNLFGERWSLHWLTLAAMTGKQGAGSGASARVRGAPVAFPCLLRYDVHYLALHVARHLLLRVAPALTQYLTP